MLGFRRIKALPEIDIFDFLFTGPPPIISLPILNPHRDPVFHVGAVRMNRDFGRVLQTFEGRDRRH